jgi:antitoxin component of MazEF toxin-antitoxin module
MKMPAKQQGRIFQHGTSGVVAIPPGYLRYHELKPGDEVTILYDSLVLIIPKKVGDITAAKRKLIDTLLSGRV